MVGPRRHLGSATRRHLESTAHHRRHLGSATQRHLESTSDKLSPTRCRHHESTQCRKRGLTCRHLGSSSLLLLLLLLSLLSPVSCSGPQKITSFSPASLTSPVPDSTSSPFPLIDPLRSLELTQALLSLDLGTHVLNSQLLRESVGLGISSGPGDKIRNNNNLKGQSHEI